MKNDSIPLVSVLVVTYNQEAYIGQALDSILDQNCPFPYEILVGEDCSTDQTRAICQSYATRYPEKIRLFLNKTNKGFIDNYFDILDQAKGRYLADCGGDDYWISRDKLRLQIAVLEKHPEVSMVFGNWQMLHQKTGQLKINQSNIHEDWFDASRKGVAAAEDFLNRRNFPRMVLSTACFRSDWTKDLIHSNPSLFRGKNIVCEDLPLILGLLCRGPFFLMKEEWMVYRVLEKSVSHSETMEACLKGFSFDVFLQTWDLASALKLNLKNLRPYLHRTLPDFIHYAFITQDREWMNLIQEKIQSRGIPLPFKQKILYFCVQHPFLNRMILELYNWKNRS
jgi:glycosyltransferase involved in cell wall biosynthesis